ncbi:MAG: C-terminal binding protein, partial [Anaerolineae bacterium]|nr:C-terminal binding protein [Anaerolineae bacterium]
VIRAGADADVLLVNLAPITARVFAALPKLRGVVRYGVGYDNVDLHAATARGVRVANIPDFCTPEVADHTLALLLALARKVIPLDASVRAGEWAALGVARPIRRLAGQTVGLIGFGRIGREVARRCMPFGLRVLAYDRYVDSDTIRAAGAIPADLETVLRESDFVSIHVPLNAETRGLINAAALRKMKRTAALINVARGPVVNTLDLAYALHQGQIAGAALDVFEIEPLPLDHPIRQAPNVILQPHVAWYSEDALRSLQRAAAEEAVRILRSHAPLHPLNEPSC